VLRSKHWLYFAVISVKSLLRALETGEMCLGKLPLAQVAKLR